MQRERDRIVAAMADVIFDKMQGIADGKKWPDVAADAADAALRVVESPASSTVATLRICTCGQSGYPESSPYSNHPHTKDCPHYSGPK